MSTQSTDRKDTQNYANSVHLAYKGELIPSNPYPKASDHPYDGYDIDVMKEMVDSDQIKKQVKVFEKELKNEMQQSYDLLSINCPVKVTKGSKEKRGLEGFILYAKEPLQGSGKALFVYDVLTHTSCMVRSSATKVRLPKYGERDQLFHTYQECGNLKDQFKFGTKVKLKSTPSLTGECTSDASLSDNLDKHGFYQVRVQWDSNPTAKNYTLTELEIVS